jgi:hypothetical protein
MSISWSGEKELASGDPTPHAVVRPKLAWRSRPTNPLSRADRAPPGSPAISTFGVETALVALGVRQLRQEHDAAAAVATLSDYKARYPAGAFSVEADLALVDAWLERGQAGQALALLERLPIQKGTRGRELLALRAELLARAGRCHEAQADFSSLLGEAVGDAAEERALVGRAGCRADVGDTTGARDDLARYRERFPNGRFAARLARAIEK